ncbi:MAG: metalloenzyme [Leptospiraceae bacterium]|nr:metalloenzyme [Leptospiraceae bacterium]MCP5495363.1 metalloenzyme [Leptospiraceae bacterium]
MILFIFIDGVGFGENNSDVNPFAKYAKGFFLPLADKSIPKDSLFFNAIYHKTDAHLGVSGYPQSATGQTSIWTGINASKIMGRHITGYPTFTLKKIIQKYSIMKVLKENGFRSCFLNSYSPMYLEHIAKSKYITASTLIQLASEIPLKTLDDLREYRGLCMDITHHVFQGYASKFLDKNDDLLKIRDPFEVGKATVEMSKEYDIALFEYFITDKVGHDMDWEAAKLVIYNIESFMQGILDYTDESQDQIIITSDHGNMEDLSHGKHTHNKVPTFLYGKYSNEFKEKVYSISDITPTIYSLFGIQIELNEEEFVSK